MADGAVLRAVQDPPSQVMALDIRLDTLRTAHVEFKQDFKKHLEDDVLFRAEAWKRISHLENLKWWILGAAAAIGLFIATAWNFGNEIAQMRLTRIVEAQSRADRQYLDSKFEAYEKVLRERENASRAEDSPAPETVRRRK